MMDAVLATCSTVCEQFVENTSGTSRIKFISLLFYLFILNQAKAFLPNPFRRGCKRCTFRFLFRFLGWRNPGQDSCYGRIPAESGRNIPDVRPFLRGNPTSVADRKAFRSNLTAIRYMYMGRSWYPPPTSEVRKTELQPESPESQRCPPRRNWAPTVPCPTR